MTISKVTFPKTTILKVTIPKLTISNIYLLLLNEARSDLESFISSNMCSRATSDQIHNDHFKHSPYAMKRSKARPWIICRFQQLRHTLFENDHFNNDHFKHDHFRNEHFKHDQVRNYHFQRFAIFRSDHFKNDQFRIDPFQVQRMTISKMTISKVTIPKTIILKVTIPGLTFFKNDHFKHLPSDVKRSKARPWIIHRLP